MIRVVRRRPRGRVARVASAMMTTTAHAATACLCSLRSSGRGRRAGAGLGGGSAVSVLRVDELFRAKHE